MRVVEQAGDCLLVDLVFEGLEPNSQVLAARKFGVDCWLDELGAVEPVQRLRIDIDEQ